jgi:hypothetical protein
MVINQERQIDVVRTDVFRLQLPNCKVQRIWFEDYNLYHKIFAPIIFLQTVNNLLSSYQTALMTTIAREGTPPSLFCLHLTGFVGLSLSENRRSFGPANASTSILI